MITHSKSDVSFHVCQHSKQNQTIKANDGTIEKPRRNPTEQSALRLRSLVRLLNVNLLEKEKSYKNRNQTDDLSEILRWELANYDGEESADVAFDDKDVMKIVPS